MEAIENTSELEAEMDIIEAEENGDYAIVIENLDKEYVKGTKVLDNVSFKVKRGDIVGYLGPNGSGKTSIFHALKFALGSNQR